MSASLRLSFSVVIPAYNAETTIAHTLRSVREQTRPADQIIVVDDGSTDGTERAVRASFPDVEFVRQPNSGSAVARQLGSSMATGAYIAYLDADDWWPTTRLAELEAILSAEVVDFLLADFERQQFDHAAGAPFGAPLPRNSTFYPDHMRELARVGRSTSIDGLYKLSSSDALQWLLSGFPVYPSTAVVRRTLLGAGAWDARFRRAQDFDFGLRFVRGCSLHYLDRVHAIIGLHDVNADTTPYVIKQTTWDIRVLETHVRENSKDATYRRLLKRALAAKHCSLAYNYAAQGDKGLAAQEYRRALAYPGKRVHASVRWATLTFLRLLPA